MAQSEPGFTYVAGSEPSTGPSVVSVDATSSGRWAAAVRSGSGQCFAAVVEAGGEVHVPSSTCLADDVDADVPDAPPGAGISNNGWASATPVLHVDAVNALLTGSMVYSAGYVSVPGGGPLFIVALGYELVGFVRLHRDRGR
ncbi:MAG: hypothetical protein R2710_22285 [Acidimicrobiales bacterium]